MEWQGYVVAALFSLFGLGCVLSIPIGLPGTWLLLGAALLVELLDGYVLASADPITFGWPLLLGLGALGLVGEGLEFLAGAAGTRLGGGSRSGMVGAIVGGLVGALLGTAMLPVPLIGTLIGALIGTFVGAFVGERRAEVAAGHGASLKAALGATAGRLAGTLGKTMLAIVMWVMLSWAAFS